MRDSHLSILSTSTHSPPCNNFSFSLLLFHRTQHQTNKNCGFFCLNWCICCNKKCVPDRFSRFDVYWRPSNRQTDKQTDTKHTNSCRFQQICTNFLSLFYTYTIHFCFIFQTFPKLPKY